MEKEDYHASSWILSKYPEYISIQEKSIFLQKVEYKMKNDESHGSS